MKHQEPHFPTYSYPRWLLPLLLDPHPRGRVVENLNMKEVVKVDPDEKVLAFGGIEK